MCKTARRCPRVVFNLRAKSCLSTSVFCDWVFLLRHLWLDIVLNHIYWCKFRGSSALRYRRCCWQWPDDHSCLDLYHIYFNDSAIAPPFHVNDLETRRPTLTSDLKWYQNLAVSKQWTLDMTWGNFVSRNAGEIVYVSLSRQSNAHVKVQVKPQSRPQSPIYLSTFSETDLLRELFFKESLADIPIELHMLCIC